MDEHFSIPPALTEEARNHIREEILDDLDEEFELSYGEDTPDGLNDDRNRAFRRLYFRELVRLQGELIKLQDWISATGHRLVVLFEGRDAAGKRWRHQTDHTTSESTHLPRCSASRPE